MPSIAKECSSCKQFVAVEFLENIEIVCPHCSSIWGKMGALDSVFDSCPICQSRQFYIQKNFNQALGCSIMLVGIVLVPWTYGLSLPVFALIDWVLHKRVPTIAVCYKCGCEFHGFSLPERLKPFMHHIGLKYDKYR